MPLTDPEPLVTMLCGGCHRIVGFPQSARGERRLCPVCGRRCEVPPMEPGAERDRRAREQAAAMREQHT